MASQEDLYRVIVLNAQLFPAVLEVQVNQRGGEPHLVYLADEMDVDGMLYAILRAAALFAEPEIRVKLLVCMELMRPNLVVTKQSDVPW